MGTPRAPRAALLAVALVAAILTAPVPASAAPLPSGPVATRVAMPPADVAFDYQLGGAYPPAAAVGIVARDRTERPVPGRYNVCYVNGFQTQPGTRAWWKRHRPQLLLRTRAGRLVVDSAWGEVLLDTSTATKRRTLARVVGRWMQGCASHGFQAVEPDNLDSWTRSRHRLSRADNVAFARLLVRRRRAGDRAEERRVGRAHRPVAGLRLRRRRGVPGLRRVRCVHPRVRRPRLRDRVRRQRRPGELRPRLRGPRRADQHRLPRPRPGATRQPRLRRRLVLTRHGP